VQDDSGAPRVGETTAGPNLAVVEVIASINKKAVAAFVDFNGCCMAAINRAWAAFIGTRLAEDFRLSQQIPACSSPEEVLEAYRSFLLKAFGQYVAEFAHMLKLGQAAASQNADVLGESVDATLGEQAHRELVPVARSATPPQARNSVEAENNVPA
jgi:hypothetical protein